MLKELSNGEFVAADALFIASIPHVSIINNDIEEQEIVASFKDSMTATFSEIYQLYKSSFNSSKLTNDFCLELLWITSEVQNQPYKAKIEFYIISRAISKDKDICDSTSKAICNTLSSNLKLLKYDVQSLEIEELINVIQNVKDDCIKAIVKNEKVQDLQNPVVPYALSYDRFPYVDTDMSKITGVLIENPNCALSIQIIPTIMESDELAAIDKTYQNLNTLSSGVQDQGIGNISFANAEKSRELYAYYSENKAQGHFLFNILLYGAESSCSVAANRTLSYFSTGKEFTSDLTLVKLDKKDVSKTNNLFPLPWAVNELLINGYRNDDIWDANHFDDGLFRAPYIITAEEVAEIFKLPIGSDNVNAGLSVNEAGKTQRTYNDSIINNGDINIGRLKSSNNKDNIGFNLGDLAKHMLVVGTPGSGKTTFSVSVLDRLWKEHGIPFLVLEPAKNEYRALVQSIPELQVFTPGKNFISPFVFNPFVPPKNVKLEAYKSTLKTAFEAAVPMSTPLDKIFEESINNCYSDFRWLDTYTTDNLGRIFNISDFIDCFKRTFEEIGYTGDARNIGRAGVVRMQGLLGLFDNYFSIPIEDLLSKPTVIELAAIENSDEKALIISLVLLSILSYVNANYVGEGGLKNVILLEEAHVLLEGDGSNSEGGNKASAIAQGLLKRMLAEIRSYGVGIIVADQSPRKVSSDVVGLTDMKVVFRLVEGEDKRIIGDSINMDDVQINRLAKLKPGEAFLFFNKLDEPEEVVTPNYRIDNDISISMSDEGIKELCQYWKNRQKQLRPYPECDFCKYCNKTCDYNRRILAKEVARRMFRKNFKDSDNNIEPIKKCFSKLITSIKFELNDEEFNDQLKACVKVHLWRNIKYGTKIRLADKTIEDSIRK